MKTIHYSIRSAIVLIIVLLLYLGLSFLFHQTIQLPTLIFLLVITPGSERLWALLAWMSPVIGTMNKREQERTHKRIVEYELSRSLRYNSPLVLAAIREKKRISLHLIEQHLRSTDVVLRSSTGYLLTLMPNTSIDQARLALQRLALPLSFKDIVVMDEQMLHSMIRAHGRSMTPQEIRRMYTQALETKLASIVASSEEGEPLVIRSLFGQESVQMRVA